MRRCRKEVSAWNPDDKGPKGTGEGDQRRKAECEIRMEVANRSLAYPISVVFCFQAKYRLNPIHVSVIIECYSIAKLCVISPIYFAYGWQWEPQICKNTQVYETKLRSQFPIWKGSANKTQPNSSSQTCDRGERISIKIFSKKILNDVPSCPETLLYRPPDRRTVLKNQKFLCANEQKMTT